MCTLDGLDVEVADTFMLTNGRVAGVRQRTRGPIAESCHVVLIPERFKRKYGRAKNENTPMIHLSCQVQGPELMFDVHRTMSHFLMVSGSQQINIRQMKRFE